GLDRGLVIDLGCGSGLLSKPLADAGHDVLGLDLSAAMLALARERVPSGRFVQGSVLTADLPSCVAVAAVGDGLNYLFDPGNTAGAGPPLSCLARGAVGAGRLLRGPPRPGGPGPGGGPGGGGVGGGGWVCLCPRGGGRRAPPPPPPHHQLPPGRRAAPPRRR